MATALSTRPAPRVSLSVDAIIRAETILGVAYREEQWNAEFTISVQQAEGLLNTRRRQRPIRPAKVAFWKNAIDHGQMLTTFQGIAISTEGELMDGQHRLLGCIEANKPIRVMVFFNRPEHEFTAYDRGVMRTVGDDLVMYGEADGSSAGVLQAAGRLVFHHDAGRVPWVGAPATTVTDVLAVMERHPKLRETVEECYHNRGAGRHLAPAPAGAFFTLFREVDEAAAMLFLTQVRDGSHIGTGFPAMLMRNCIERDRSRRYSDARQAFMIRLVHAWNAFYEDRTVNVLFGVLRDGRFPRISGYRTPK
jgi:hypothetical protein